MKNRLIILGSTGSVGRQTLDVIDFLNFNSNDITVLGLSANSNIAELELQIRKYRPIFAVVTDKEFYYQLRSRVKDTSTIILCDICGIQEMIFKLKDNCNLVLNAIVGIDGFLPSIAALQNKIDLALANKESMVVGGTILRELATKNCTEILPVDSEHYAIFSCLNIRRNLQNQKNNKNLNLKKIVITASGGPFHGKIEEDLENVSLSQTLNHPTYQMGKKITVDCATLINKALEIIEAHYLFGINYEDIEVVIHRQSIIHSMIEFCDNSVIAQMSLPDMKIPIQGVITYPDIFECSRDSIDWAKLGYLTFENPKNWENRALSLAYRAGKYGRLAPVILNSANEAAVQLFLENKIKFLDILKIVESELCSYISEDIKSTELRQEQDIEKIIYTDRLIKEKYTYHTNLS